MNTLSNLIRELQTLEAAGHGELPVFGVHSSSGTTGEVGSASVSDYVGESGPFDLDGKPYIDLTIR